MKKVSLKSLKENLSTYTEEASQGQLIEVTKYNRPFVYLVGAQTPYVHRGAEVGKRGLKPAGHELTKGRYSKALSQDRDDDAAEADDR